MGVHYINEQFHFPTKKVEMWPLEIIKPNVMEKKGIFAAVSSGTHIASLMIIFKFKFAGSWKRSWMAVLEQ